MVIVAGLAGLVVGASAVSLFLRRRAAGLEARVQVAGAQLERARAAAADSNEATLRKAAADAAATVAAARIELDLERAETVAEGQRVQERQRERTAELERRAVRAEAREEGLSKRQAQLDQREVELENGKTDLELSTEAVYVQLERLAELDRNAARRQLLERVEVSSARVLARRIKQLEEETRERAEQTAKNIISMAIQRYAGEYSCERTVSLVNLQSEELKGRIIGREGRNIRALEAATGVDFIIDDTPSVIVISAFNPIRREVARRTLEVLLEDGRIHPSRIESVVRKTESGFHKLIRAAGQEAADEVGVAGLHPEILKLVGALRYRTSYGQNQWQHAVEVAFICGMMASELGLDAKKAKRAGLLHDIGKVMDQTAEGSHALIGGEFARKHGEEPVVVNAIASHHEEVPQETIYACLAQAADAISGARPGARRQMMKSYNQRLTDLERISNAFPGVERSYAVQAGREVRIIVENGRVSDEEAVLLSHEIAQKIEADMAYPGQIKVTVIRETRVVNYAR